MKTNKEILMKFVSTQGYKRNSPDKNRPVNVIPSNEITMQDVDFPVRGVDNQGNEMVMQPGEDYTFPGDYVIETPIKQQGGNTDSTFEDVAEVFDPTGISSWDDVYRSYKQSGMSPETFIEVLGAIPILGKLGKASKAGIHLTKYSGLDKTLFNMLPKNNALSKTFNATSLAGRGSDAYQGYNQFGETRLMPTPVRDFNPPIKKEGGENDREMVEGIADILTQVKDPANRKRIAKNMVADFKRENVKYNLQDFLSMSKVQMKEGGEKDRSIECSNCGWSWKESNAGSDPLDCHKCGGKSTGKLMMQMGGQKNKRISFDQWYQSVPQSKSDTASYNLRRAYDLAPQNQLDSFVNNPEDHLYSVYPNDKGVYEFMKSKNHPTVDKELEWFNSSDPEAIAFRNRYALDSTQNYYKYVPKKKSGGQYGGLDRWFAEKWVDVKTGEECGRQEGEKREGYPACRPSKRISEDTPKTASELSSSEKEKFKRTKTSSERIPYQHERKEDGGENYNYDMEYMKEGGNVPTNPELWSRAKAAAKSKYDVYPSAYANGYAAKWYKEKGGGWRKAQKGGTVEPIYVSDKNDPRLKAYTDSLNLYNQGLEPFMNFDNLTGKSGLKEYSKKNYINYIPGGEGAPVNREQILKEIGFINEELEWQDRPSLIKNANDRLALLNNSLETGVYPANLISSNQPINAIVYKKPVVPVKYNNSNEIVKEQSYNMDSKQIGSEEQKKMGGCMKCGGTKYEDGGAYSGYMINPMEMMYQEGGEAEESQEMQQGPEIEAAIGEMSNMIAQGEDPSNIYSMLIESGVPEEYAQGYLSEAMSDLEEDDMEEEDVPMDEEEMQEFEESSEEEDEEENEMKRGGSIKIRPSRKGTFKAQATKMGMSVQEAAEYILRHKDEFTPLMVKKANFAKNFAKELGGEIYNLEKFKNGGGIPDRYRNLGFTRVGAKRRSTRPGKKWMVLAKKGDQYKVVHGGYKGMKDFTQHRNPKRRERFWNRMGGKNSAKATDPFSPLYWHKRFGTWQEGGGVYTGSYLYKAQTGGTLSYEQWLSQNMNRPDVMQNSQSPDYLVSLYQSEVQSTPSQTPATPRMTRTSGSGMGAMEILDPMVPNADNPYDLTLPATPPVSTQVGRLVAPPGWNAMNNTEGLSTSGTGVQNEPSKGPIFNLNNLRRKAGDIMLGSMGALNQKLSKEDYEKQYKKLLQDTGNSDQRYNAYNPSNPFGNYTLNAGPGSNFALVTNTPMQDFGTRMSGARYGGTASYKQGGEYYASNEEINMILAMGGEIEFLD